MHGLATMKSESFRQQRNFLLGGDGEGWIQQLRHVWMSKLVHDERSSLVSAVTFDIILHYFMKFVMNWVELKMI